MHLGKLGNKKNKKNTSPACLSYLPCHPVHFRTRFQHPSLTTDPLRRRLYRPVLGVVIKPPPLQIHRQRQTTERERATQKASHRFRLALHPTRNTDFSSRVTRSTHGTEEQGGLQQRHHYASNGVNQDKMFVPRRRKKKTCFVSRRIPTYLPTYPNFFF